MTKGGKIVKWQKGQKYREEKNIAHKFCTGHISRRKNLVVFLEIAQKIKLGFSSAYKELHKGKKSNGAKSAKNFWQDEFCARKKIGGFFQNCLEILVGIPSDKICPPNLGQKKISNHRI